jgi:hypothetical protein
MSDREDKDDKLIETLHSAIKEMVSEQRQTNERLDQTNERLNGTNERLDNVCLEFRSGFAYLAKEQIKTNERLDATNSKLDGVVMQLGDFRVHVSKKMDGIGTYLMSIDDQLHDHEKWLRRLDERFKPTQAS